MAKASDKRLHLAGYVRVSHVGGREGESFRSPEDQERAIRQYAKANGHRVTMFPPDLDESGGKESRPNLDQAVEAVESGALDGIIVAYGSRLMRNVRAALSLWERIEAAGGRYINVALDLDATTPEGRMMRTQLAAMDEYELDRKRAEFDRLKRESTERGIWQRRQTPTGYDKDPETRRLVPNADAPKVVRAFEQRAAGQRMVRIADGLGMTPNGTRRLLANRVYLGEVSDGPHVNPNAHPPIVPVDLFDRCQVERPRPPRAKDAAGPRLLAGVIRCGSCGFVMIRSGSRTGATYRCPTHHSGERCPAPAGIVAERVESYVTDLALHELDRLHAEGTPRHSVIEELEAELTAAEAEVTAYLAATSAADLGAELFAQGLEPRRARREAAEAALHAERQRDGATSVALGGREAWDRLDAAGRNEVVRAMFDAVVVRTVGRGRQVPVEDRVVAYRAGAGLRLPRRTGEGAGLHPLPFDPDSPEAIRL